MKLFFSLSTSDIKTSLENINYINKGDFVFISLHVNEDNNEEYIKNTKFLIDEVNKKGGKIIADISKRSLEMFNVKDIFALKELLNIYAFRFDYGFSKEDIVSISKLLPIVINASTLKEEDIKFYKNNVKELYAMHNFYPRPETGLDLEYFKNKSKLLKDNNIPTFAFIPGNKNLRGPLFRYLPTIEIQRGKCPYINFIYLSKLELLDGVFIPEGISKHQIDLITQFRKDKIIRIISKLDNEDLYNKELSIRLDSPKTLLRVKESREYSYKGNEVKPYNTIKRKLGFICMDNINYKRYSGEIMIPLKDYPADEKVNVIGYVDNRYMDLLKLIKDSKFMFIKGE